MPRRALLIIVKGNVVRPDNVAEIFVNEVKSSFSCFFKQVTHPSSEAFSFFTATAQGVNLTFNGAKVFSIHAFNINDGASDPHGFHFLSSSLSVPWDIIIVSYYGKYVKYII